MQHKVVYLLFCKFTVHVSGVNHTHHQEYTKLPPLHKNTTSLQLQFCVLLLATLDRGSCTASEAVLTVLCTDDVWG